MKLLAVLAVSLSLVGVAAAGPRAPGAPGAPGVPGFPNLPGNWSHADINVTVRRVPHTLTLDRGRIVQLSASQLTLLERDGSTAVIPITPETIVTLRGRPGTILNLRKKQQVETMRIDGGPAVRVRVTSRF